MKQDFHKSALKANPLRTLSQKSMGGATHSFHPQSLLPQPPHRATIIPMNLHPTSGRFTYCYWYPPAARRSCALL